MHSKLVEYDTVKVVCKFNEKSFQSNFVNEFASNIERQITANTDIRLDMVIFPRFLYNFQSTNSINIKQHYCQYINEISLLTHFTKQSF